MITVAAGFAAARIEHQVKRAVIGGFFVRRIIQGLIGAEGADEVQIVTAGIRADPSPIGFGKLNGQRTDTAAAAMNEYLPAFLQSACF